MDIRWYNLKLTPFEDDENIEYTIPIYIHYENQCENLQNFIEQHIPEEKYRTENDS